MKYNNATIERMTNTNPTANIKVELKTKRKVYQTAIVSMSELNATIKALLEYASQNNIRGGYVSYNLHSITK